MADSSPGAMIYRGPGMEKYLRGTEGLSEAMFRNAQIQSQRDQALAASSKERAKELQRTKDLAGSLKINKEGIPAAFLNMFNDYAEGEVQAVANGEVDLVDSQKFLNSLHDQMIALEGERFNDVVADRRELLESEAARQRFGESGASYQTIISTEELDILDESNHHHANYGWAGINPEDVSTFMDPTSGAWTSYFTVDRRDNNAFITVANNFDRQGNAIQNVPLQEVAYFGEYQNMYPEDAYRTVRPSKPSGDYARYIRSEVKAVDPTANVDRNSNTARSFVTQTLLRDPEQRGVDARWTVYTFEMDKPEEERRLTEDDINAWVSQTPEMIGPDARSRFDQIMASTDVQNFFIDGAVTEKKEDPDIARSAKTFEESKSRIGGSYNIYQPRDAMSIVNGATGEIILDDYAGEVETYSLGGLRTGGDEVLRIPNPRLAEIQALPAAQRARVDMRNIPETIELKVEEIEIYRDIQGRKVVGLVSYDGGTKNPPVFLELGDEGNENARLLNQLEKNINAEYPGVTLEMFFNGEFRGQKTTPASQPSTPTIDYSKL